MPSVRMFEKLRHLVPGQGIQPDAQQSLGRGQQPHDDKHQQASNGSACGTHEEGEQPAKHDAQNGSAEQRYCIEERPEATVRDPVRNTRGMAVKPGDADGLHDHREGGEGN